MSIENYNLVVDSYAWIEFFLGSKLGDVVKSHLERASILYTPSIVCAELARKYLKEDVKEDVLRDRLSFISDISIIVNIDLDVCLEAANTYMKLSRHAKEHGIKHKPSLADAIIFAVSRIKNAKILTGDVHFMGLNQTIWMGSEDL